MHKALSENPPYDARVEAQVLSAAAGWSAPILSERTSQIIEKAARMFFHDKPPVSYGEGGTIPFMGASPRSLRHCCSSDMCFCSYAFGEVPEG